MSEFRNPRTLNRRTVQDEVERFELEPDESWQVRDDATDLSWSAADVSE